MDLRAANRQQPAMCEAPVLHVGCGLCGRAEGFVTVHERLTAIATPSRVLRCPDCGLVFLSPRLDSKTYDWAHYTSYLETNYLPELLLRGICTRPMQFDRYGNLAWHAQLLDTLDDFRTASTLLDVGCSIGTTLLAANDRGWNTHGVESSAALATYGVDQLSVNITIGEFDQLQLPWRDFDCVTMLDYLPHCFEPFQSIRLAHSLLHDGGVLFVSVPNVEGRAHQEHGTSWCCWVTDHYVYYNADADAVAARCWLCATTRTGRVGEHLVPMPHFGLVLLLPDWRALAERMQTANVEFVIPPQVRTAALSGTAGCVYRC
jgi:2-polyprenyl-3-methyl-5-hydroxy-6-metoxy-1,4-benzoquinol methylase